MNDPRDYEPAARVVIMARLGRAFLTEALGRAFLTEANIADVADMIARNAPDAFSAGQAEMRSRCAAWHEARAAEIQASQSEPWPGPTADIIEHKKHAKALLALPLASDDAAVVAAETEEGDDHG